MRTVFPRLHLPFTNVTRIPGADAKANKENGDIHSIMFRMMSILPHKKKKKEKTETSCNKIVIITFYRNKLQHFAFHLLYLKSYFSFSTPCCRSFVRSFAPFFSENQKKKMIYANQINFKSL